MGLRAGPRRTKSGLNVFAYIQWRLILKYFVIIEGIDPAPDRVLGTNSNYIEGCRLWANANLNALPDKPQFANAEAVICENVPKVVERIKRKVVPEATLEEKVVAIVEEIGMSITKDGQEPLTVVEIAAKLQLALEMVKGKS
jgi:hypothetical protein